MYDILLYDNSTHSNISAVRKRSLWVSWSQAESVTCCLWARYFCWNSTHVSPALRNKKFNFKRSMVHTRDCLPRNTGRRISLQYVNVRRVAKSWFPGLSGCIRLQLDGSIVALSSGADHVEIKVLKFHREAEKEFRKLTKKHSAYVALRLV